MSSDLFQDFLNSNDTLRIYTGDMLAFSSQKDRLLPLMEYLDAYGAICQTVEIYDKVVSDAAALLAIKTLGQRGIKYHFSDTVPYITRDDGKGMCPMEELSLGKTPDEFYKVIQERIAKSA